jgi:2-methylisocitrate lyase-like PEP mutase family enzyme
LCEEEIHVPLSTQGQKAETLRALHRGPSILILPNAWDVTSARIVGYTDGQQISRAEMLEMIARIAAAVRVPVTADFEAGYGLSVDEIADSAKALVAAGAVGLNFEDITGPNKADHVELGLQVQKIQKLREASTAAMGVPLVVNARTDIYLLPIGPEATRFDRSVERLRGYRKAGADCVFAPGVTDAPTISRLVRAVDAPLNILLTGNCPAPRELEKLGVARVSAGSGLMRSALGHTRRVARELLQGETYASMLNGTVPFAEVMKLIGREGTK